MEYPVLIIKKYLKVSYYLIEKHVLIL